MNFPVLLLFISFLPYEYNKIIIHVYTMYYGNKETSKFNDNNKNIDVFAKFKKTILHNYQIFN